MTTARYSAALRTPYAATGAPYAAITAGAKAIAVKEIGAVMVSAIASSLGVVRAQAVGTATSSLLGQRHRATAGVPTGTGSLETAWSTAPTVPTNAPYMRRVVLPAATGTSITWTFDEPIVVEPLSSLLVWNHGATYTATGCAFDLHATWDEG